MADDPLAQKVSGVVVSLKAGPYEAPWITIHEGNIEDALKRFDAETGDKLARLMQETTKAQASFTRMWNDAKNQKVAQPGQYGKPAGATTKSDSDDLPFANSADADHTKCEHGPRSRVEASGKVGWICSVPKGEPGRCATVFE